MPASGLASPGVGGTLRGVIANPHDRSTSSGSVAVRRPQARGSTRATHRCAVTDSVVAAACILLLAAAPVSVEAQANEHPAVTEPRFEEIPEACGYLTEELAQGLLRAKVRAGQANEHIPTFWSQCAYSGQGVVGRQVSFVFKFMLWTMFDVESLDPEQLSFNVTFAMSGVPPLEKLTDLGKVAFTYEKKDRSMLLVVTGFQGPPDGAGRPTEFIATYQLSDPDTPHEERLERLLDQARRHMAEWQSRFN